MGMLKRAAVLVLIATGAACSAAPAPGPMVDVAAEEAAVRAVSAQWLKFEGARDAAGIAGLFADDGRLVWNGQDPIVGPAAIQAFLARQFEDNPKQTSSFTTAEVMISSAGDMAVEYGRYVNTASGKDATGSDRGSYVTVYQKVGGAWKVKADASASAILGAAGV